MSASILAVGTLAAGAATAEAGRLSVAPDAPGRLVLETPATAGWDIARRGREIRLSLPGVRFEVDGTALPDPALAPGITGLASEHDASGTRIRFDLVCDCRVAVEALDDVRLAIDVIRPSPADGATLANRTPLPPPARRDPPAVLPRNRPDRASDAIPESELARVRTRLLEQLEQAASAGLITLRPPASDAMGAPASDTRTERAAPDGAPARRPAKPNRAARVPSAAERSAPHGPKPANKSTAIDFMPDSPVGEAPVSTSTGSRRPAPGLPDLADLTPPRSCPDEAVLRLPDPSDLVMPQAEVARLSRGLVGEFDRPREDALRDLVRLQLALGLAIEARATLDAFGATAPADLLLRRMSRILGGDPEARLLPEGLRCGPHATLWQSVALTRSDPATALALAARADRAMQEIAPPLRRSFATRLGLAAAGTGDWLAARRHLAMAERGRFATEPASGLERLLAARLKDAEGARSAASELLAGFGPEFGRRPAASEALVRLAERRLEAGARAPSESRTLRLDLGALALAARGTALGARAAIAEARLTAREFGRSEGTALLDLMRRQGSIDAAAHARALRAIATDANAGGPETPLAEDVMRDPDRFAPVANDPAFLAALALSHAETGRPERAEALFERSAPPRPALRAAIAEAYLAADRGADALRMAEGLAAGSRRAILRAEALAATGDPAAGLAVLEAAGAGAPEDRVRLAAAAGDWQAAANALAEQAADNPDPAILRQLQRMRVLANATPEPPALDAAGSPDGDPELARYLEALDAETAAIRELLDDG